MIKIFAEFKTALAAVLVLAAILCGLYPLTTWLLAQGLFPARANGSLIVRDGVVVGWLRNIFIRGLRRPDAATMPSAPEEATSVLCLGNSSTTSAPGSRLIGWKTAWPMMSLFRPMP